MRAMYVYRGGRTCFPSATAGDFMHRIAYVIALARLFRGAFVFWGGRTCFPGRD